MKYTVLIALWKPHGFRYKRDSRDGICKPRLRGGLLDQACVAQDDVVADVRSAARRNPEG